MAGVCCLSLRYCPSGLLYISKLLLETWTYFSGVLQYKVFFVGGQNTLETP